MLKRLPLIISIIVVAVVSVVVAEIAESYNYIVERNNISRYYQHLEVVPDEATFVEGEFNTKLPIVSIETGGQEIPGLPIVNPQGTEVGYTLNYDGETTISADITIFDEKNEYNQLSDTPAIQSDINLRIRGNSSRYYDKKSYKIEFVDQEGLESNVDVMGMGRYDEWALYGPFLDKTLIRNYVYLNLYGELYPETPDMRYCQVFMDGEYVGLYLMMETVAADNDRVNLTSFTTRRDVTSYIVELDKSDTTKPVETFTRYTQNLEQLTILSVVYPGVQNQTQEFLDYIANDVSEFEKALYSYDFDDPEKGYRAHINVDSFVDYYIINEFAVINDMANRSTYLYKDLGGKLTMSPLWDFNNAADHYYVEVPGSDTEGYLYYDRVWYTMLMKDPYFVDKVIERYRELRTVGILNEQKILELIDQTTAFLEQDSQLNFEVWGYSFDPSRLDNYNKLMGDDRNSTSYTEAIQQLETFMIERGRWLDQHIEGLKQYCATSRTKYYTSN